MTIWRVNNPDYNENYEEVLTYADEFCGPVHWFKYDFDIQRLTIRFRLDTVLYQYWDIPADKYAEFRAVLLDGTLEEKFEYVTKFKLEHECESI